MKIFIFMTEIKNNHSGTDTNRIFLTQILKVRVFIMIGCTMDPVIVLPLLFSLSHCESHAHAETHHGCNLFSPNLGIFINGNFIKTSNAL